MENHLYHNGKLPTISLLVPAYHSGSSVEGQTTPPQLTRLSLLLFPSEHVLNPVTNSKLRRSIKEIRVRLQKVPLANTWSLEPLLTKNMKVEAEQIPNKENQVLDNHNNGDHSMACGAGTGLGLSPKARTQFRPRSTTYNYP